MKTVQILSIAGFLLSLGFYLRATLLPATGAQGGRLKAALPWLAGAAAAVPFLWMCAASIPLPLFYLFIFAANCIPLLSTARIRPWERLFISIRFLLFCAPHLILLGMLALLGQSDIPSVLGNPVCRMFSLTGVLAFNAALYLIVFHTSKIKMLHFINFGSEEFRIFLKFIHFCSLSVLFDSIPCLYKLPAKLAILFLIGSNILLLLMAVFFAYRVYTIATNAYLKEEHVRLMEEQAKQQRRTEKLEKFAYTDMLTGAYTRRYAISNMNAMLEIEEAFFVAFLDLDHLKQMNDQHGHQAGDQYLQAFAGHMKANLRPNDIFVRYGGDEFLILMPGGTWEETACRLSRIQSLASAAPPAGWGTPFSYGLVETQADARLTAEDWITAADRAMYEDKQRRRAEG